MKIFSLIIIAIFAFNILCVLAMIFIERKKPQIIVSWLVTMTFLPLFGFLLYVLIGSGLSYKTKRMLKKKKLYQKEYNDAINSQKLRLSRKNFKDSYEKDLTPFLLFNINNANSAYYRFNNVRIFTNGEDKITALKKDLLRAKHSINMLYYIFADDIVGNEILNILTQKAKEGVKVKLLFDSVGSLKTKKHFFKPLIQAGGEVAEFFPPLFGIRLINLKLNYRNHRKIVVIDGKIAYTGGINIRDDHMGRSRKLRPWRDTHLRMTGQVVYGLQSAFFNDWRFCKKLGPNFSQLFEKGYFVESKCNNKLGMQIITSGPDDDDTPIKDAFLKMILSAKERIVIQTPYFIPDDTMLSALNIARMSGVKIDIMIPAVPDKKIVYMATLSYVKELLKYGDGVNVYLYNGFLHSKMIMVDGKVVSIGTCNFDNRSFALNFEDNVFIYSQEFATINNNIFNQDISNSHKIDLTYFARKRWYSRLAQAFFRLFSPLL